MGRRRWTFPWALEDGPDKLPASYRHLPQPPPRRQLEKILGVVRAGGNRAMAAAAIGRSERWLKYILEAYPVIKNQIEDAAKICDGLVQQKIFENAQLPGRDGATDRVWWTKNRLGWADRQHISATVDVNLIPQLVARSRDPELVASVRAEIEDGRRNYVRQLAEKSSAKVIDVEPQAVEG